MLKVYEYQVFSYERGRFDPYEVTATIAKYRRSSERSRCAYVEEPGWCTINYILHWLQQGESEYFVENMQTPDFSQGHIIKKANEMCSAGKVPEEAVLALRPK